MSAEAIQQADKVAYLWPEPEPLRRDLPPPAKYPTECLGGILQGAFDAMGETIQSPDAIRGQSLLAAASLAVQGHADIELHGRQIPTSLYMATIGESGERKSATDSAVLAPHEKYQRDMQQAQELELEDHRNRLDAWKAERAKIIGNKQYDDLSRRRHELDTLGPEPQGPISPLMLTSEPTYEGLVKALLVGWPSMGLFSDEGGRFLGGHAMLKDNQLKTAAGLSSLWDGKAISRTRGGDGNSLIYGKRLSLHLMIQPCLVGDLFGSDTLSGQGLLSRILPAYPDSRIGQRPYRGIDLKEHEGMRRYFAHAMSVLETDLPIRDDTRNELEPRKLRLASDAVNEWVSYHDHVEKLMQPGKSLEPIKGFGAKTAEHALRIAGVLALFSDISTGTVSAAHMEAGIAQAQFYVSEALRLFHANADCPDLALAEKVLAWGRAQQGHRFGISQLYQRGPNAVRDKAKASRIMGILAEHGWAYEIQGGAEIAGHRYRSAWEVRP